MFATPTITWLRTRPIKVKASMRDPTLRLHRLLQLGGQVGLLRLLVSISAQSPPGVRDTGVGIAG